MLMKRICIINLRFKSLFRYKLILLLFFLSLNLQAQTRDQLKEKLREAIIALNNKEHEKSLQLLAEIRTISEANNWYKELFLAHNNIGLNYYLMLDYGEALNHYLEAYKISIKELDQANEVIALNNIAILYLKEEDFDKAEEHFFKAYEIAIDEKNDRKIGMYATNLASVATEKKEIEKAEKYIQIALEKINPKASNYLFAKVIEAKIWRLKEDYAKTKEICLEILPQLKGPEFLEARSTTLPLLAEIMEKEGKIDEAIHYITLLYHDPDSTINEKLIAYKMLSDLYSKKEDFPKALLYKDSMLWAKDSVNHIKNGKVYENNRIKFELQNKEKELADSKEKLKVERRIFLGTIGLLVILALVVLWAIRNHFTQLKQRKIIAENNQKIVELELEKERNQKALLEKQLNEQNALSLLEKEKLKNELEAKNRKLTAKALSFSAKNELIEEVLNELSKNPEVSRNPHLKKHFQELRNHLKKDAEWEDFFTHFEEVNQGFLKAIKEKHPDLNANDIRFISYLYMNLSNKEISSLLNITVEACRKRKERISKKMNLAENIDLYDYISAF